MDKKLSFSISSKSPASDANQIPVMTANVFTSNNGHINEDNSSHHFITEFDSTLNLNHDSSETQKLIIAPIDNEYRPGKQTKSPILNEGDGEGKESIDNVLLKKLKDDINRLPDNDESFDQFEDVPVEGFGAALMAGYGFKDGMGIGKNAKQDVKVVEYKRWVGRGGLGAFSDLHGSIDNGGYGRTV